MAYILPLISTLCIVISAILVAIGWVVIRRGDTKRHIQVMAFASIFAVIFFVIYMSRTIFIGNTAFGGPDHVAPYYHLFLLFHIVLATLAAVLGLLTLYYGFKQQYNQHKRIGPLTSVIWFLTAVTGVTVYLLLYVIYPPGETTNLLRAIIGG
ncbi:protein of unknown function DUF420 [Caldalkalibacillus thermarum TA2.A1]|uniref:DUF420 domain-containing protein n=1 Tax=Caldalkalibacillus thermarum (strain TA2.A1) TaxID=986075 RepID=F5L9Q0_CALTT|nr:DUF420 domain-containing protein [Caldalkalibacillus thermarum]EGL81899.1 protein of unknown function DUF420 [Caldalkalibacillus thermarum TA2.A1]QZT32944.1 DUF420 domain-containing protein [Caldalkalibacillus thermarum TA2.A1]